MSLSATFLSRPGSQLVFPRFVRVAHTLSPTRSSLRPTRATSTGPGGRTRYMLAWRWTRRTVALVISYILTLMVPVGVSATSREFQTWRLVRQLLHKRGKLF